jgi:hypothetical protein
MNILINEEIAPEVARAIIAQATLRGLSVNDYLRQLLGLNGLLQELAPAPDTETEATHQERPFYETATAEEWVREFTKWADSHDPNTPALPLEAVSRESICEDR